MMVANAGRRYTCTVDLDNLNLMLGGELIAKVVNDDGKCDF